MLLVAVTDFRSLESQMVYSCSRKTSYHNRTVLSSLPVANWPFSWGFQHRPKPSLVWPLNSAWGVTVPVGRLLCLVLSKTNTLPSMHIVAIIFGFWGWYLALLTSPGWSIFCSIVILMAGDSPDDEFPYPPISPFSSS